MYRYKVTWQTMFSKGRGNHFSHPSSTRTPVVVVFWLTIVLYFRNQYCVVSYHGIPCGYQAKAEDSIGWRQQLKQLLPPPVPPSVDARVRLPISVWKSNRRPVDPGGSAASEIPALKLTTCPPLLLLSLTLLLFYHSFLLSSIIRSLRPTAPLTLLFFVLFSRTLACPSNRSLSLSLFSSSSLFVTGLLAFLLSSLLLHIIHL